MLFNSYEFIFLFLPIVVLGFFTLSRFRSRLLSIGWLVAASLFFYGYWNPKYLLLILASIIFNYYLGNLINQQTKNKSFASQLLLIGIVVNLGCIGYFKYAHFFVNNLNILLGNNFLNFNLENIILPLGISFFTFQQIAYLVDSYQEKLKNSSFLNYCLFVTFFPQLIAGPIVHYQEMIPQFEKKETYAVNWNNIAIGLSIFSIGLFKKVVLADSIAIYANPIFSAAESSQSLTFLSAWLGALAYTFQLYFDFSGYADMAIGIARIFGIILPLNFYSPYKSVNITEFWRRWHMTLSRFLRDYLYIPLGGNRQGIIRRYINLLITMLLGGLWHGAGWTFIIWGGLHGCYLVINHGWHNFRSNILKQDLKKSTIFGQIMGQIITFFAVVITWVFFRATSLDGALHMSQSMLGMNGFSFSSNGFDFPKKLFIVLFFIIIFLPNTQEIMKDYNPSILTYKIKERYPIPKWLQWHPNALWSVIIALFNFVCLIKLSKISEFLYFQF
ncbi:MAG: MBOAT family protein [Crocosphaera sp.]|nr:MBOAT family protein [Crocosphaera sp.]